METMRLIVTGSVGAGKSTFIRSFSEIEVVDVVDVVDTDTRATDETALLKQRSNTHRLSRCMVRGRCVPCHWIRE
jgi:signal recognition particle receptor subunit beta